VSTEGLPPEAFTYGRSLESCPGHNVWPFRAVEHFTKPSRARQAARLRAFSPATRGRTRRSASSSGPLDDPRDIVEAFDLEVRGKIPGRVRLAGEPPLGAPQPGGDHPGRHRPLHVEIGRGAVEHVAGLEAVTLQDPSVRARIRLRDAGLLRRADEVRLEALELRDVHVEVLRLDVGIDQDLDPEVLLIRQRLLGIVEELDFLLQR